MRARLTAICIDTAAVVGFVALGRGSHAEGEAVAGIATVAAPFLIGLAVGWIAMRRTTLPAGRRTGTVVWACTTAIGLAVDVADPSGVQVVLCSRTPTGRF